MGVDIHPSVYHSLNKNPNHTMKLVCGITGSDFRKDQLLCSSVTDTQAYLEACRRLVVTCCFCEQVVGCKQNGQYTRLTDVGYLLPRNPRNPRNPRDIHDFIPTPGCLDNFEER